MPNLAVQHNEIIDKCQGCDRVQEMSGLQCCVAYPVPGVHWRLGNCNLATHIKAESKGDAGKVRVGQQKQKKK
ncbi:MAG: PxxKW family cysteine-rich protein [Deltaproteobacteria bacterium]|jgi:hypothetical protein|nr:PxxKW family cysteine-rich protein [Deltaproteobacteria bacterium]